MLDLGAVTFWEEYDPSVPKEEQYDMYGDHFGKSLCHAWAASPIYFLAKYFAGLDLVNKDGVTYVLKPQMQYFTDLDCTLPVGSDGTVRLAWDGECLEVTADAEGGVLELGEEKIYSGQRRNKKVKIEMKKIDLTRNWTCRCLTRDEEPYSVTLPHDAMRSEPRTAESVSEGKRPAWYLGGDYEYNETLFLCRQSTADKKFSLSLKVFIIMQKSILMERKPHTDHMVIQISM